MCENNTYTHDIEGIKNMQFKVSTSLRGSNKKTLLVIVIKRGKCNMCHLTFSVHWMYAGSFC